MDFLVIVIIVVAIALLWWYFSSAKEEFTGYIFGGRQRQFDLFLQDPWYDLVKSGKKTLETRVGTADKWNEIVGKTIKCKNGKEKQFEATIVAKRHYKTLDEALDKEKYELLVPSAKSKTAAKDQLMAIKNKAGNVVYEKAHVESGGGIIVFEIKVAK